MSLVSKIRQMILHTAMVGFLSLASNVAFAQIDFNQWFENKVLRIDYFLSGNSTSQQFFLDDIRIEPHWSGSLSKTITQLNLGTHIIEVTDLETDKLLYSHGYCTLFQEWQTVNEAKHVDRAFEQVARIPMPKNKVLVTFKYRNKEGKYTELYHLEIDPKSIYIGKQKINEYPVTKIIDNGDPNQKLDIAFIAEGYTADQMEKFRNDVTKFANYLFSQAPFDKMSKSINIWAIESDSENEGPTNPGTGVWNKTAVNSSFYTFGIDRYLTTTKYKKVMDIAANAPGDIVYILINSKEYGGGGIFNHYNVTTSDHELSNEVFIHELGHGLAGLGDEYYTSDVAYQEFYPLNLEPWEPNITTLVDFSSKWADMVQYSTPIPTPSTKNYSNTVGAYEGGGYVHKGVYRPFIDCRMKSNSAPGFCPVCQRAIVKAIETYTE